VQAVERATMVRRRVWGRSSTSASQASRSAAWCGTHFTGLVSRTETAPAHRLPRFTSSRPQRHASSGADDAAHPEQPDAGSHRQPLAAALTGAVAWSRWSASPRPPAKQPSRMFELAQDPSGSHQVTSLPRPVRPDPRSRSAHQDHEHLRNGVR